MGELNNFFNTEILPFFKQAIIHEVCTDKIQDVNLDADNIETLSQEQSMKVIVINHRGGKKNEKILDRIQKLWDKTYKTYPSVRTDIPAQIVGHKLKIN